MLSPDDARIVRRDRELPGLAHVLDPQLFQDWLQQHVLAHRIDGVRPRYTRYKPGTNCLVAYDVDWAGGSTVVTVKAFRPPAAGKLAKFTRRQDTRTSLGPAAIVCPELTLAALVFPYDLKMRALARVMGEASGEVLGALMPGHVDIDRSQLQARAPTRCSLERHAWPCGRACLYGRRIRDGQSRIAAVDRWPADRERTGSSPALPGAGDRMGRWRRRKHALSERCPCHRGGRSAGALSSGGSSRRLIALVHRRTTSPCSRQRRTREPDSAAGTASRAPVTRAR